MPRIKETTFCDCYFENSATITSKKLLARNAHVHKKCKDFLSCDKTKKICKIVKA